MSAAAAMRLAQPHGMRGRAISATRRRRRSVSVQSPASCPRSPTGVTTAVVPFSRVQSQTTWVLPSKSGIRRQSTRWLGAPTAASSLPRAWTTPFDFGMPPPARRCADSMAIRNWSTRWLGAPTATSSLPRAWTTPFDFGMPPPARRCEDSRAIPCPCGLWPRLASLLAGDLAFFLRAEHS